MKKQLIARTRFNYGRKPLRDGDQFKATRQDAKILVGIGKARYLTAAEMEALKPVHTEVEPETPAVVPPSEQAGEPQAGQPSPVETPTRRRYRRRDMQAQE